MSVSETAGNIATRSRGVLGPLFAILTVIGAQAFGIAIAPEEAEAVVGGIADILVKGGIVISSVIGIVGRFQASGPITRLTK